MEIAHVLGFKSIESFSSLGDVSTYPKVSPVFVHFMASSSATSCEENIPCLEAYQTCVCRFFGVFYVELIVSLEQW